MGVCMWYMAGHNLVGSRSFTRKLWVAYGSFVVRRAHTLFGANSCGKFITQRLPAQSLILDMYIFGRRMDERLPSVCVCGCWTNLPRKQSLRTLSLTPHTHTHTRCSDNVCDMCGKNIYIVWPDGDAKFDAIVGVSTLCDVRAMMCDANDHKHRAAAQRHLINELTANLAHF